MTHQMTTLHNGLRVLSETMPHSDTVSLSLWVNTGSRYEKREENGIAHLLEHMAFKGTKTRSAQDIAFLFDGLGGQLNASTSTEFTVYYIKLLQEHLSIGAEVLADIVQNPTFPEEELERERQVILQEIAMYQDMPDELVQDHFQAIAYPEQPLGRSILGPAEQVAGYGSDLLRRFMRDHYHADNMVLAGAGKIDHSDLVILAEQHFGEFKRDSKQKPEAARYIGGEHHEQRDLEQLHMLLGFEGLSFYDEDYYTLQIASTILGGGMSSRLFQEVREKRGLAYSVYSYAQSHADSGLLGIYIGTSPDKGNECLDIISRELTSLCREVTAAELDRAKAQVKAGMLMAMEYNSARADRLGRQMLCFGRIKSLDEMINRIEQVSRGAVCACLEKIVGSSAQPSFATIGPNKNLIGLTDWQSMLALPKAA